MFTLMKDEEVYKALPARVSRGVLRILDANWLSFFSCFKKWEENKSLFNGEPNIPKYLKKDGKFTTVYFDTAVLTRNLNKGFIGLSKLKIQIPYQNKDRKIIEVQVVPLKTKKYKINICYDYQEEILKENNKNYCAIDLGINNLMTLTSNKIGIKPVIVNGRPLKSINQYYNKIKAEYQSELP